MARESELRRLAHDRPAEAKRRILAAYQRGGGRLTNAALRSLGGLTASAVIKIARSVPGLTDEIVKRWPTARVGRAGVRKVTPAPWWALALELEWPSSLDEAKRAFRSLAIVLHPDQGGNAADFIHVNRAIDEATTYYRKAMRRGAR